MISIWNYFLYFPINRNYEIFKLVVFSCKGCYWNETSAFYLPDVIISFVCRKGGVGDGDVAICRPHDPADPRPNATWSPVWNILLPETRTLQTRRHSGRILLNFLVNIHKSSRLESITLTVNCKKFNVEIHLKVIFFKRHWTRKGKTKNWILLSFRDGDSWEKKPN